MEMYHVLYTVSQKTTLTLNTIHTLSDFGIISAKNYLNRFIFAEVVCYIGVIF